MPLGEKRGVVAITNPQRVKGPFVQWEGSTAGRDVSDADNPVDESKWE